MHHGTAGCAALADFPFRPDHQAFLESYQKQKQFITDAGHELKTPPTIIDGDAEVLEMGIGENEWLSDIQTQTKRLAQLTKQPGYAVPDGGT